MARVSRSLLALALLLAACGSDASAEGGGHERPPALVEVAQPREGALRLERTYLGMVRSTARAELAAGAAGEVVSIDVREGDRVEAGQVLVRIDPDVARASLRAAQADARSTTTQQAQASREARRYERAGERLVGGLEIERASAQAAALDAQRESRRASLAQARATLARHTVIAPFAGVIAARRVDPGDWASPGTPVLELVVDDRTEVLVRVEPALLEDIGTGYAATLRDGERTAEARVEGVVRALDLDTRTAQVRLSTATAAWLLPGSTVDVVFAIEHEGDGLIVPRDALVEGVTATRVVRVVDGQALPTDVEVVERGASEVRVRAEGLSTEDQVVTRGNERLRPEQAVRVAEPS